jgi:hypothetical protein
MLGSQVRTMAMFMTAWHNDKRLGRWAGAATRRQISRIPLPFPRRLRH